MLWILSIANAMPKSSFITDDGVKYHQVLSDEAFQNWIEALPNTNLPTQSPDAAKAFWINAYNGLTIQTVAENIPLGSIRSLDDGQLWSTRRFIVANQTVTLDQIEKEILGQYNDPRIHAALSCASKGCPTLFTEPFTETNLNAQLNMVSQYWLRNGGFTYNHSWLFTDTISMSKIFEWYNHDFPCDPSQPIPTSAPKEYCGALQFVAHHAPEYKERIEKSSYQIVFQPYDWSLNSVP